MHTCTYWLGNEVVHVIISQTFFHESPAEERELSVLKRLKDGHFSHENLCAVLDVSLKHAPVSRIDGTIRYPYVHMYIHVCISSDIQCLALRGRAYDQD